jgi:hypothetical protein
MSDRILYSTDGSTIFEIGANTTNSKVTNTLTISKLNANGIFGSSGQVLTTNSTGGTYWSTVSGGGGSVTFYQVTVDFGSVPVHGGKTFNIALPGATTTQKVVCCPSLVPGTSINEDEFEIEPWNAAARIIATDTLRLSVFSTSHLGYLHGEKNINLILG